MRDIEEAAQAVSGGMVGQRDAIAMAAGGHPQLVEAVSSCLIDLLSSSTYLHVSIVEVNGVTNLDICVSGVCMGLRH